MHHRLHFTLVCVCLCVCLCVYVCVCLSGLGVYANNSRQRQKASSRNAQLGVFQGLFQMVMSQSFTELL